MLSLCILSWVFYIHFTNNKKKTWRKPLMIVLLHIWHSLCTVMTCITYVLPSLLYLVYSISPFIEYQNKKHAFNWLNTLHVTFTILRCKLGYWYRLVQEQWIGATCICKVYGPVYISSINRNFKTPSMILIKSTLKCSFVCM